jgi:hypothetical protein
MGTFVETAIVNYSLFIVCRPRKTNFRGFAPNKRLDIYSIYINIYVDIDIYILHFMKKKIICKTEAQAIFLNPFTVRSSCKRKFIVCPFVDEETTEVIHLQTE